MSETHASSADQRTKELEIELKNVLEAAGVAGVNIHSIGETPQKKIRQLFGRKGGGERLTKEHR